MKRKPARPKRAKPKPPPQTITLPDGTAANVADDVGRASIVDGVPYVDELGLALRMGLADPSPEDAGTFFGLFELLPGEERPEPGEVVEGVPVFAWLTPQAAAGVARVTTRQLANYERAGLPSRGRYREKRYPLPHVSIWTVQHAAEVAKQGRCDRLPFRLALARHRVELAENDTEYEPPTRRR